ncbi:MAG: putative toxin-antitoxin system toxin component, PIN family [Candidatus Thermoplasmatota archaeon]
MRVVLDTNVLISAFFWDGNERQVVFECRTKTYQSVSSPAIIEELNDVLSEKFEVPDNKITNYIQDILFFSEIVFTEGDLDVIKEDPDDNYILETAVEGGADLIITGDNHLLQLGNYNNIKIKNSSDFLDN